MNLKGVLIATVIFSIIGITMLSFSQDEVSKKPNNYAENNIELIKNELPAKGINIDYRTGKVTQIVPDKPELSYMVVRGSTGPNSLVKTGKAITEEELKNAESISDVIENYPSNWITGYNSVTIVTTVNGETIEAVGPDDKLTQEQKKIFNTASNILIVVQYQKTNNRNEIQNRQMNVSLVVTPEVEAQYNGGYDKMISYLKEMSLNAINDKNFNHLPQPSISFIVNETGIVKDVKLIDTSRDNEIDDLLIKVVQKMPNWKPAVNKKGETIQQEFILNIGQNGC